MVEPEAERGCGGIGTGDAVRERRIADHQIEAAGEIAAGVVLAADAGFRVDEAGNPRRDRIIFDSGELRRAAQGASRLVGGALYLMVAPGRPLIARQQTGKIFRRRLLL